MMTSSNGNISHVTGPLWGESMVTGGFHIQSPGTGSFDVLFDLRVNKRLSTKKQTRRWWFETPPKDGGGKSVLAQAMGLLPDT